MNIFSLVIIILVIQFSDSARVLGIFPVPSFSHQQMFQTIWKELTIRGHDVTVVSPDILNDSSLKNLTEIDMSYIYSGRASTKNLLKDTSMFIKVPYYHKIMKRSIVGVFENENVKNLIESRVDFDVLILQSIDPLLFAIAARYRVPIVGE